MEQFEQCLICKAVKNDPNAVYTSDGEMVCQECQEWIKENQAEECKFDPEV